MLYVLALHIIFIVTWFAGLFYIVRLFIYHTEAQDKPELEKNILQAQFKIMEKRLWYGITWPSMILTYIFGFWLVSYNPSYYFSEPWFFLKLVFVFALTLYHIQCHVMFKRLQNDIIRSTSFRLRIWNEVATVLLVAIVFTVITKSNKGFMWGIFGLLLFTAMLYFAIWLYKRSRTKNKNND